MYEISNERSKILLNREPNSLDEYLVLDIAESNLKNISDGELLEFCNVVDRIFINFEKTTKLLIDLNYDKEGITGIRSQLLFAYDALKQETNTRFASIISFKLVLDEDKYPFNLFFKSLENKLNLSKKLDFSIISSVLAVNELRDEDISSALRMLLFFSSSNLSMLNPRIKQLASELKNFKLEKKKREDGSAQGRIISAKNRGDKSKQKIINYQKIAIETYPKFPLWTELEMAKYIQKETGSEDKISTIKKRIGGIKTSVLKK